MTRGSSSAGLDSTDASLTPDKRCDQGITKSQLAALLTDARKLNMQERTRAELVSVAAANSAAFALLLANESAYALARTGACSPPVPPPRLCIAMS